MKNFIQIFAFLLFTNFAFAQNDNVDPEYQLHHDKLKELNIKRIHSESYIDWKKTYDGYMLKARYEENRNNIKDIGRLGAWVRTNLSKTNFKSIKDADHDWEELLSMLKFEHVDNNDFHEYFNKVLALPYGPKLIALVDTEIMSEYPKMFGLTKEKADKLKEMLKKQQE